MSADIQGPLAAAVEGRLAIHVVSIRHEARFAGVLTAVTDDGLLLELGPGHPFGPLDMVSASFSHGARTYTFLANVLQAEDDRVWLAPPRDIVSADRRIAPRFVVSVPVEVEVLGANPNCRPTLADIAVTGMKVQVKARSGLRVGERVSVVLTLENRRVELTAELRHETAGALGFFFPDTIRRGRLAPSAALTALVDRVRNG